jgi:hypothetical protein
MLDGLHASLADLHAQLRGLGQELDLPEPETLYNCKRIAYREVPDGHTSIDNLSPVDYERLFTAAANAA